MKKIGIVGVGIMGSGMVRNFIKNGYDVYIYNRSTDKVKDLIVLGAKLMSSPRQVAEKADIIFEVTSDDDSSKAVWLGEKGILEGGTADKVLIASATLSVSWVEILAKNCEDKKLNFLDIPLTGGRSGAESGKLIMLAGGDKSKLDEISNDLAFISEQIFYFGPVGSGAKFKLILNMIQGIHLVAFGEAMRIAESSGLDTNMVGEVLASRMGAMTANGWKYYKVPPDSVNFSLKLIEKDLRYAKLFRDKVETPLLDETLKKFKKSLDKGLGDEDLTIVNRN